MDTKELTYEAFLESVSPNLRPFVDWTHRYLLDNGCKFKLEDAKSGYVASYPHTKSKRVIANFVFRKMAPVIRIYGDHVNDYIDFMHTLPEGMVNAIDKAPVCKRLADPTACNSRCPMGFDFTLGDTHYQKCRYNGFMFPLSEENNPFIKGFIENEVARRPA